MNDSTQNECDKVLAPKYGLYEASKILILRIVATWLSLLILWTNTENGKAFFNLILQEVSRLYRREYVH